tara:strand:+ start:2935 stop:3186 length:252 start_codon:yes stop_codon:yes gene_type:complete
MIDGMTIKEIVELAYSEFKPLLPITAELKIKLGSDDGGRQIEFIVNGKENAQILRNKIEPKYNNMRTIVIYSYDREPDLEDSQ